MTSRLLPLALLPIFLSACVSSPTSTAPLTGKRAQAEQVARQFVSARDPVIDPAPAAACIARSATGEEVNALLAGTVRATVTEIVRRRSTQDCFAANGTPDFGIDLLLA